MFILETHVATVIQTFLPGLVIYRSCYIIPDASLTGMLTPRHVYSERPGDGFIAQSGGNWKKNNFTHDLDFICFYLRIDWGLIRWVIPALDSDTLVIYRSSYFLDTRAASIPAFWFKHGTHTILPLWCEWSDLAGVAPMVLNVQNGRGIDE